MFIGIITIMLIGSGITSDFTVKPVVVAEEGNGKVTLRFDLPLGDASHQARRADKVPAKSDGSRIDWDQTADINTSTGALEISGSNPTGNNGSVRRTGNCTVGRLSWNGNQYGWRIPTSGGSVEYYNIDVTGYQSCSSVRVGVIACSKGSHASAQIWFNSTYCTTTYITPGWQAFLSPIWASSVINWNSSNNTAKVNMWNGTDTLGVNAIVVYMTGVVPVQPPGSFNLTSPTNGATNRPLTGTLHWGTSSNADVYYVYLDTEDPPNIVVGTPTGTSFDYGTILPLDPNTTYYWDVIAFNSHGNTSSTNGPFHFTTVPPPSQPIIRVSPANFSVTLQPSGTTTRTLTIYNDGEATLNWSISESPSVSWLSESPTSGSVSAGSSQPVTLYFTAPSSPGTYNTTLVISSNDPSNPTVNVPVQLIVGGLTWSYVFQAPGPQPDGLAWDGAYLWITSDVNQRIYKVNPANGSVITSIPSPGSMPTGLAWDGTYLWCGDGDSHLIYKLNPSNGNVISSFPAPGSVSNEGLAWDGTYIWNTNWNDNIIWKLNPNNGQIISQFSAPGNGSTGLTWENGYLWNSDQNTDRIYRINPANGQVVRTEIAPDTIIQGLTFDGQYLWTCGYYSATVYRSSRVGIEEENNNITSLLSDFNLSQCHPNPFYNQTMIRYSIPIETEVNLKVFNTAGRVISSLVSEKQKPGIYNVTWNLKGVSQSRLANGIYFYRLEAGEFTATKKMVMLR